MKGDLKDLEEFLIEAHQNTYANKDAVRASSLRPKSQDYHFEKGGWVYHDTYFGGRNFIGGEVIYKEGEPVWGMNYCGHVLKSELSTKEAYQILKPALMKEDKNILSVRGPVSYEEGNNRYQNRVKGDLKNFSGTEEIFIDSEVIYRGFYHGGLVE